MENGKIHPVTYETDHLFLFHHINAYEQDEELIVDVSGYSDADVTVTHLLRCKKIRKSPSGVLLHNS